MALHEQPRENLIRDAIAYEKRALLRVAGIDVPVFWGQRAQGGWSIYFGEDPVFQFSEAGELRRAFVNGVRYAARDGKLFKLTRDSSGGKVEMTWHFDAVVEKEVAEKCLRMLKNLATELKRDDVHVIECVPADAAGKHIVEMASCLVQSNLLVRIAKQANT